MGRFGTKVKQFSRSSLVSGLSYCHVPQVRVCSCRCLEAVEMLTWRLLLGLWSCPLLASSLRPEVLVWCVKWTPFILFCFCTQDSLLRLKDHRQCFECSDVALNEAVQQMLNSSESAAKEEWVATVTQLLLGIEQALSSDSSGSILKESSSTTGLVRLTNNLIQVTPGPSVLSCLSRCVSDNPSEVHRCSLSYVPQRDT